MQQAASYIEIVLSAFLLIVIIFLAGKFIVESVLGIGCDNATLEYFLENVMTFAIGVEFVKMLCTHTPGTVIEVLLFAISRQMIVGHVSGFEVLAGVAAIAGLVHFQRNLGRLNLTIIIMSQMYHGMRLWWQVMEGLACLNHVRL